MDRFELPAGPTHHAVCRFTERSDGDLRIDAEQPGLDRRRAAVDDRPWTWLRQVHGSTVVTVASPGGRAGTTADGSVTTSVGAPLAVQTADCVPALLAGDGVVGAAHAGWRGIAAGILGAVVTTMRESCAPSRADQPIRALLGPHIRPARYEFGAEDLRLLSSGFGSTVEALTVEGAPALDLAELVRVALARHGVVDVVDCGGCTASSARWYSHRVRGDSARQASVITLEEGA